MTEQSCCTLCGAAGHCAAQCNEQFEREAYDAWRSSYRGFRRPFDPGEWDAWQARAALAQPSPAPELPAEDELEAAGLGYPLSKEEAVKLWYSGFRSEVITVLEAWEAIGHDIGMNPDKGELLASLRYMLEKCEAHDAAQARVAELEKQEPFYYFADCDDPDYSRLYNTEGDALSQISDHGGDVVKLYAAPVAPDVALPPMPTDAMLKAYREVSPSWLCLDGWRAMMEVAPFAQAGQVPKALTQAQMRRLYENSTEAENEGLGFAAFARLMRRAEAVHQIAAAPAQGGE